MVSADASAQVVERAGPLPGQTLKIAHVQFNLRAQARVGPQSQYSHDVRPLCRKTLSSDAA